MWLLCSGLPCPAIVALIVLRSNGWLIPKTASVEMAVMVVALAAVLLGLPTMILVSQSISDPVRDVVDAMADVERGNLGHTVAVYERSEIGRLQSGFNRMVTGLQERDRLRDLFGRHVGDDVARLLVERDSRCTAMCVTSRPVRRPHGFHPAGGKPATRRRSPTSSTLLPDRRRGRRRRGTA